MFFAERQLLQKHLSINGLMEVYEIMVCAINIGNDVIHSMLNWFSMLIFFSSFAHDKCLLSGSIFSMDRGDNVYKRIFICAVFIFTNSGILWTIAMYILYPRFSRNMA